jgi:hypothetical protein
MHIKEWFFPFGGTDPGFPTRFCSSSPEYISRSSHPCRYPGQAILRSYMSNNESSIMINPIHPYGNPV